MFTKEELNLEEKRVLLTILDDNIKGSTRYYIPPYISNIEEVARFDRYIVTDYDSIFVTEGVEERTFEIYNDFTHPNLYFLIQKAPLSIDFEPDFVFSGKSAKEIGYNVNKIYRSVYYTVLRQIVKQIVNDFDIFLFMRFSFTHDPVSTLTYAVSKDLKGKIPLIFTDVSPTPMDTNFRSGKIILTPTVALYFEIPKSKALYDFQITLSKVSKVVGGKLTYIVDVMEYLDSFFQMVLTTLYPM